ncbi:MAG: hypothetical protein QM730_05375 [Anaerolineales bacterium]
MKRVLYFVGLLLIASLLTGCTADNSSVPMNYRWANVEGSQLNEVQAGEQFYFNILVDDGMIEAGTPIKIKLSGNVNSGSLRFELRDPQGQVGWNSGTIGLGDFSIQTEYSLPVGGTGTYQLGMVYGENTSATYNLGWHAIQSGTIRFIARTWHDRGVARLCDLRCRQKDLGMETSRHGSVVLGPDRCR